MNDRKTESFCNVVGVNCSIRELLNVHDTKIVEGFEQHNIADRLEFLESISLPGVSGHRLCVYRHRANANPQNIDDGDTHIIGIPLPISDQDEDRCAHCINYSEIFEYRRIIQEFCAKYKWFKTIRFFTFYD